MELNINFDMNIGWIIDKNKSLSDWFERNQDWMAYYELTHAGCLHFENSTMASKNVRVLSIMANAALTILEDKGPVDAIERADKAAKAIAEIYELNKDDLSENDRKLYAIDIEDLEKKEGKEVNLYVLERRNGIKNRRPGRGHRRH